MMHFQRAMRIIAVRLSFAFILVFCACAGVALAQTPIAKPNIHSFKAALAFEPNLGQNETDARYVVQGLGYSLSLRPDEARIRIGGGKESKESALIQMKIRGARSDAAGFESDKLASYTNYLVGDRSKWLQGVPHYGKVRFERIFDGIDVVYYGTNGKLEYDFIVAPGVDPSILQLSFEGARNLSLVDGNLQIGTAVGNLELLKPTVYQEIEGKRRIVESSYLLRNNEVRFQIASYDATLPLVIDPTLSFLTPGLILGSWNVGEGIAVRTVGGLAPGDEVYVVGTFDTGNSDLLGNPDLNVFVAKFGTDGQFAYQSVIGGSGKDHGVGIAVDNAGNVFVAGSTNSTDFASTPLGPLGGFDGFLVRLTDNGTAFEEPVAFAKRIGGSGDDRTDSVALLSDGDIYVAGATDISGSGNGYVAQVSATGTDVTVTPFGPVDMLSDATARSLRITASGTDIYVAGTTSGTLACPALPCTAPSGTKAFAVKLTTGTTPSISYTTYISGSSIQVLGTSIVVFGGNSYLAGSTTGVFVCSGCLAGAYGAPAGVTDAFIVKLDGSGTPVQYTYLGGGQVDNGIDLATDGTNVVLTGDTADPGAEGVPFPTQDNAQAQRGARQEAFIATFDSNLALITSTFLGGPDSDFGRAVAMVGSKVFVVGYTTGSPNTFVSALDLGGLSISSITISGCNTSACPVSDAQIDTTIATATVELGGIAAASDQICLGEQVPEPGLLRFSPSCRPGSTTSTTYTFDVIYDPTAPQSVGSLPTVQIEAKLNNGLPRVASFTLDVIGPLQQVALSITPTNVAAGQTAQGTLTLNSAAPPAGTTVLLASSNTAAATVPTEVTIPGGATSTNFTINTSPSAAATEVIITATLGALSATATLEIRAANTATTTAITSASPITYNQNATVEVAVSTGGTGTVTGNVTLRVDNGAPLTQALSDGSATFTIPNLNAGAHSLLAAYVGQEGGFAGSVAPELTLVVNKATPVVTWSNPADITYPAALSSTQLNATASIAGAFAYTPAAGTILPVGDDQILSVDFTPADAVNYNTASKEVRIDVKPGGVVPFSAFTVDVEIHLHRSDEDDNFRVEGDFTLGALTDGINPATEPVTLRVGDYTLFIPAGSFHRQGDRDDDGDDDRRKPKEVWSFIGKIGDDRFHIRIRGFGDKEYDIRATGRRMDMTGVVDGTPIDVMLAIGDDNGTATDTNPKIHPRVFTLKDLDLYPRAVLGGNPSTGKVTLKCNYGVSLDVPVTVYLTAESGTGVSVPPTVTIPAGTSCGATFPIATSAVSRHVSATITARVGESKESASLSVHPFSLKELDLNPGSVFGSSPSTGTVALRCEDGLSLTAPVTVQLTAEAGTGVSVPSTVTIPAGTSCRTTFPVTTSVVTRQVHATITATLGYSREYATLTVNPITLKDLSLNPKSVYGGSPSTATVTLDCSCGSLPTAPVIVQLAADGTGVSVPSTIVIPAGSCSKTFTVTTTAVSKQVSAKITAALGGSTVFETLTVKKR